jgi:nitroreductase
MELLDIMRSRKSVRNYADTPIPQGKLDKILETASLAPTSRNRKPCTFIPVTERTTLEQLSTAKNAGAAFTAKAGAAIVVAADSEISDTWVEDSSIAMTYMMLVV